MTGAGRDIGGTWDEFHFAHWPMEGNIDVRVRLDRIGDGDPWAKAGLMIRNGLKGNAKHAFLFVSPDRGLGFRRRRSGGQDTQHTAGGSGIPPAWLRLVRDGDRFSAYRSSDGHSWALVGQESISMSSPVRVGLAVTSHDPSRATWAVFSNLSAGARLPHPWTSGDLGGATPSGSADASNGTFTVRGGGTDVWNASDQFHYVYQPVSGDMEIIARLTSLDAPYRWSKAGVMIRETLAPGSRHAYMLGSGSAGWAFQRRPATGGISYTSPGPATTAPGWVRLVREGSLISGYHSTDGATWRLVDSDTVAMATTVYVGLAVTSHDVGALATATFAGVVVRALSTTNQPPQVALTAPLNGATFRQGDMVTLQAAATDPDGTISRVDLFSGSTRLKSDATSPYTVSWTPPAGQHAFSAVAVDNDGQPTASPIVTIAVASSGTSDRVLTLAFTASSDHKANVTSYSVSVYRAADPLSASPVAAQNIGKPAPVNGDITVDLSTLVSGLASGTYKMAVIAIGPGGSTRSAPSPDFDR